MPHPPPHISYDLDARDCIVRVNPGWTVFAKQNAGEAVLPEQILGRPLWPQIACSTLREMYVLLLRRARGGNRLEFSYRCDSPSRRRRFYMAIFPGADDVVHFESRLIWQEHRSPVRLLDVSVARDVGRSVRVCSWCQRVALPDQTWEVVENAVPALGLLEESPLPAITHGICAECTRTFFEIECRSLPNR